MQMLKAKWLGNTLMVLVPLVALVATMLCLATGLSNENPGHSAVYYLTMAGVSACILAAVVTVLTVAARYLGLSSVMLAVIPTVVFGLVALAVLEPHQRSAVGNGFIVLFTSIVSAAIAWGIVFFITILKEERFKG